MIQTDRFQEKNKTGEKLIFNFFFFFSELLLAQLKNKNLHFLCSFADILSQAVH